MKWNYLSFVLIALCAAAFFLTAIHRTSVLKNEGVSAGTLSLIVEPDDGMGPVLDAISGAKKSLDVVMYELEDARIESALAADEARGVAVRVVLCGGYKGAPPTIYTAAYDFLRMHGVPVRWSPGYFSLTHEKSMVVDGDRALIMTFNWVSKYYATGRDFGIFDTDPYDIAAIEHTFGLDWSGSGAVDPGMAYFGGNDDDGGDDLLWSPGAESSIIDLIERAERSLYVYNEEMADMDVTKALIDAARRGVAVYVVMTNSSQWKWQFAELITAGAHVRTYADETDVPLYIHAKMIVSDDAGISARAFVGSENFSKGSLNENRELGIVTGDRTVIARLMKTFAADWRNAAPFVVPK